jgi:hypothetical protein
MDVQRTESSTLPIVRLSRGGPPKPRLSRPGDGPASSTATPCGADACHLICRIALVAHRYGDQPGRPFSCADDIARGFGSPHVAPDSTGGDSTGIGSGGYGDGVRFRFVGLLCLAMAALAGCVTVHPTDAGAAGGRPERAPAGSAGAASPGASVRELSYPEPLPDCQAVQVRLPRSVLGGPGQLVVFGRSVAGAPWQAVSCQYVASLLKVGVTVDRPSTDPVDGRPAAAALAMHPAALLAARGHCTGSPATAAGAADRLVLHCSAAGPTPPGPSSSSSTVVAYTAGPAGSAGASRTLLVNASIDGVDDQSRVQRLADELYAAIAANL